MIRKTIQELEENYDLQLDKAVSEIKKTKARVVLLQFPDGLKPYATLIADYFEEKFKENIIFLIWLDSCFGACDVPVGLENLKPKIDLIIQFGHNNVMPRYL